MQLSKTVYFSDYPSTSGSRSGLTIPFPESDSDFYNRIACLSSYNLRQLIGFDLYTDLEKAAHHAGRPVATYARELIRKKTARNNIEHKAIFQATFRGGKGSPLHEWYPYLEGYSPDFVASIISSFAPEAQTVLDPFCGSGTTALVAALSGRRGLYAEVNPVCHFTIEAKAQALKLKLSARHQIADRLREIEQRLTALLQKSKPDDLLRASYTTAFGDRPFYDAKTYDVVLRLRSLIDSLADCEPAVATFLTVATLRSLVPGSLLVRRGDLRFRTKEELGKQTPDLLGELRQSIDIVASDLFDADFARGTVKMVCDDARAISQYVSASVDAVITSPPYLNGTNYFRNTKIELWFLRRLASKQDLRFYRDVAITAGINDVTQTKVTNGKNFDAPKLLQKVVSDLEESAYDRRIPLMVRSYFREMGEVVEQLRSVTNTSGVVAIDLGDSCYGEVWVPTDQILTQLMERSGFRQIERIVLRERQSRDGRKLSQTLQVFRIKEASGHRRGRRGPANDDYQTRWVQFRDELPHQQGEMAKRNWGHSWHSLCSYQGKLKPSIARALTEALLPASGGRLLDPFSGVGTIPFEARLQGHTAYAFDISPAATIISRAKLEAFAAVDVYAAVARLKRWIRKHEGDELDERSLNAIRFNGPLPSYFHERTLREIVAARRFFLAFPANTAAQALVESCLLHILHGNRPYALSRRSHPITPFAPTGPTEYKSLMERLLQKLERCLLDAETILGPSGWCYFQDATAAWPSEVDQLDAIITSPPFFDSTRFHTANWMRLWFTGWESEDFTSRPGSFVDERQKRTFEVYDAIFKQGAQRLKVDGHFAIHLGKSVKCDMAAELTNIGTRYLTLIDSFAESVSHCESHGIRDKGTVTHHQYLLFRKK